MSEWWGVEARHWQRTGVAVAAIALIVTAVSQCDDSGSTDAASTPPISQNTFEPTPDPPYDITTPPDDTTTPPEPSSLPSDAYNVTAQIEEGYRVGKDKALACENDWFCLEIEPYVLGPDGPVESGCHIQWEFYSGSKPSGKPINRSYDTGTRPCEVDGSVDVVLPDINGIPLPPGPYTFVMRAEMDDGTEASGTYHFKLVDGDGN